MSLVFGSEDEIALRTRRIAVHEAAHAAHAHFYEPTLVDLDELRVNPLEPHCSGCELMVDDLDAYEAPAAATDRAVRALIGDYAVGRLVDGDLRVVPLDVLAYAAGVTSSAPEAGELNWRPDAGDVRNAAEALRVAVEAGIYDTFDKAYAAAVDLLSERFVVMERSIGALADAAAVNRIMQGPDVRTLLDAAQYGRSGTALQPA